MKRQNVLALVLLVFVLTFIIPTTSIVRSTDVDYYDEQARSAINNLPSEITISDKDAVFEARRMVNEALRKGGLPYFIGNIGVLEAKEADLRAIISETYKTESLLELTPVDWLESDLGEMSQRFAAYDDPESWTTGRTVYDQDFGELLVYSRGHRDLDKQPQWIEYDISDKPYKFLEGYVGIIDTSSAKSYPPSFVIYGEIDGEMQVLFAVDELYRDEPAYHYFIDVSNVDKIRFHIESEIVSGNRWTNRMAIVEPIFYMEID